MEPKLLDVQQTVIKASQTHIRNYLSGTTEAITPENLDAAMVLQGKQSDIPNAALFAELYGQYFRSLTSNITDEGIDVVHPIPGTIEAYMAQSRSFANYADILRAEATELYCPEP